MKILNFGNDSLAGGEGIERAVRIISASFAEERVVVIISALNGVAEALVSASEKAVAGESAYLEEVNRIREKHVEAVQYLLPPKERAGVITPVQIMLNDLEDLFHGVQLIRECSGRTLDLVLSFGTRLGCLLIDRYLNRSGLEAVTCDAGEMIKTNDFNGSIRVDFKASYERIRKILKSTRGIALVAGGIASARDGVITILKGDGSDYTASLIGAAMEADSIEIRTDAEGVMSADPVYVPEAFVIPALSYQEAMELSYFGARLLHPQGFVPAMEKNIPIRICSVFKPELPGTLISNRLKKQDRLITGIASVDQVALVNVEGGGMIGTPGIAARIFTALARARVNIMMISQASSEHSICLVFRQNEADKAREALQWELSQEIEARRIQNFDLMMDLAVVAIIGENMQGTPGISGRLFSSLGSARINVLAIAQGSSERNISFVIEKKDQGRALQTIHQAFLDTGKRAI